MAQHEYRPTDILKGEDNLARVRKLKAPLLVIAGGEDEITPAEQARTLCEAAASERAQARSGHIRPRGRTVNLAPTLVE